SSVSSSSSSTSSSSVGSSAAVSSSFLKISSSVASSSAGKSSSSTVSSDAHTEKLSSQIKYRAITRRVRSSGQKAPESIESSAISETSSASLVYSSMITQKSSAVYVVSSSQKPIVESVTNIVERSRLTIEQFDRQGLHYVSNAQSSVHIFIITLDGTRVLDFTHRQTAGMNVILFEQPLARGVYYMNISSGSESLMQYVQFLTYE
ncbi:MAG: hypothetical protein OCD01_17735, partial [Fibrobacterales bacterium]